MSRLTLLILGTGIFNLATAEVCTQIADDEERLACFDATRACAAIGSDTGRIDCFDSAYSGAGSSDIRIGDANVPEHLPVASDSAGGNSYTAIYVGQTEDLKERLGNHHKQGCFDQHNYNAVSVHRQKSSSRLIEIEADLVEALKPPCNA